MKPSDLLRDAKALPGKTPLEDHRETILVLRDKGYTWREIATFFTERGVATDHTKIFRLVTKTKETAMSTKTIPSWEKYKSALADLERQDKISTEQRKMLRAHYQAHDRTMTYTELATEAGYEKHFGANSQYGRLGRMLGENEELGGFEFTDSDQRRGKKFFGSSIGRGFYGENSEFHLVMHHELAKAIEELKWFDVKE